MVRTTSDALDDRVVGLSAEVAFFAMLSLPPLLLTIVAALGFVPGDQSQSFVEGLVAASQRVFSIETVEEIIQPTLEAVVESERIDVLSIAFLVAVFSASRAVRVVLTAVTIAYDLGDRRPSWAQRLYGLLATLGLLIVVPIVMPLLLGGPDLGAQLAISISWIPPALGEVWPWIYWGGIGFGAVLLVAGLYHLAAPWWTPFRRDLPGAILAVSIWLASSAGLRTYADQSVLGSEVFRLLAGPLVLLVWLYLIAFGVILGGELNAELERLFPSPEQQRAPSSDRLRRRLLDSTAAARLEQSLPGLLPGRDGNDEEPPGATGDERAARAP